MPFKFIFLIAAFLIELSSQLGIRIAKKDQSENVNGGLLNVTHGAGADNRSDIYILKKGLPNIFLRFSMRPSDSDRFIFNEVINLCTLVGAKSRNFLVNTYRAHLKKFLRPLPKCPVRTGIYELVDHDGFYSKKTLNVPKFFQNFKVQEIIAAYSLFTKNDGQVTELLSVNQVFDVNFDV